MSAINEKAVNGTQLQRTHKKIYRHLMPLLIVAYPLYLAVVAQE